ncbi:MAG TPA: DUF2125 domain-containing protein [Beijerinckiaceae bacterium]|nr:DUF2125 domain-containing protein [Beijerinckiaceae bacterium]
MDTAAPAPQRSRKGLYIPLILFALACLGWAGFWFFAKSRALDVMDAWLAREARLGREWTCPQRTAGGFPFRFEVSCTGPTFASAEPGRAGKGSLGALTVTARVVDPRQVIAAATGPLKWTSEVGDSVEITFDGARASYRGSGSALEELSIDLANPLFTYTAPGLFTEKAAAGRAEFHMRRAPGEEAATDLVLIASAIKSALADQLTGETANGRIDLRTRLTKLLPSPPRNWRETLELWRVAGGEARVEKLALAKGPIVIEATGALRLDETRRLDGEITGSAQGLPQILQAFGLGGNGGGLLGSLLSGGRPQQAQPAKALPFALRFAEGRLFIGPIPGPRLRPLF